MHRATNRFWEGLKIFQNPFKDWRERISSYSKPTLNIHRCILRKLAGFGRQELVSTTGCLLLKMEMTSFGCGLARMMIMSE